MFFRKSLWSRAGGFDPQMGRTSDNDFILRTIDRPIVWINQKLFRRREHDKNLWRGTVRNRLQALRVQRECLKRCPLPPEVAAAVVCDVRRITSQMRMSRHYLGALLVGTQLALLNERRLAIHECWETCIYPFRAVWRKAAKWIAARI